MRSSRLFKAFSCVAGILTMAACANGETSPPSQAAQTAESTTEATVDEASRQLLPASIRDAGALKIAASFRTPPLSMLVGDGQVRTGLSYDMASFGALRLGLEPSWSNITYPGQTPAIQSGKVDLVWEITSVSDERINAATFVIFARANQAVLVADGNPKKINAMADMCGQRIGVSQGSVFVGYVEEQSRKCTAGNEQPIEVSVFDGAPNGRIALQSGKVDGYMSSQADTTYFANTTANGKVFDAVDLPEIPSVPVGIQVSKGNQVLAKAMQSLVNGMIKDGSYAEFFDKYDMPDSMKVGSAEIVG